jgi:hypothetical protein
VNVARTKVLAGIDPCIPEHYSFDLSELVRRLTLFDVSLALWDLSRAADQFGTALRIAPGQTNYPRNEEHVWIQVGKGLSAEDDGG